ncbi:hypothetical protein [Neorhodopirellula pilleata]|nr:hypothetical protein [Neorhodopirellula pilleata]
MSPIRFAAAFTLLASALMMIAGCETATQEASVPTEAAVSSEYLLAERPAEVSSLSDAAESLGGETKPMTLIGKIDAGDFPAFEADSATFMLSELPADGHGADDPEHEDNCPFCKRRAANAPKAIVQIVDGEGNVIPTDARQLIGLNQGDKIIAVGEASFDEAVNAITVKCQKVHAIR